MKKTVKISNSLCGAITLRPNSEYAYYGKKKWRKYDWNTRKSVATFSVGATQEVSLKE